MVEKVFSIGGSVVQENLECMGELAESLEVHGQIVVVTGAGELKKYVEAVKDRTNKAEQDMVGIEATRLNARTVSAAMDAYPVVPETPDEVMKAAKSGDNVVMGGLTPAYSTDAVAATVAELLNSDLYVATTVDGVYDPHPEDPDAERLEKVSVSDLRGILGRDSDPGGYRLIDSTALDIVERSGIETKIFRGLVSNIEDPDEAVGTEII